jgi:hypothetical protein
LKKQFGERKKNSTEKENMAFLLRGVQAKEIFKKYSSGEYSNREISSSDIKFLSVDIERDYSKNMTNSDFYSVGIRPNVVKMVSIDRNLYEEGYPSSKICDWCRQEFETSCVNIPLSTSFENGCLFVYGIGMFHDFRCALAYLLPEIACISSVRDSRFRNSEVILRYLWNLKNPGKKLIPANHWKLLSSNRGPLSDTEWNSFEYIRSPKVIFIPSKEKYIINKSKKT